MLPKEIIEYVKKKVKDEYDNRKDDTKVEIEKLKDEIKNLKIELKILKEGDNI